MDTLDTTFLDELKLVMGEELGPLFESFFRDTARQLDTASRALRSGDAETLRKTAHSLKGAAASVAAAALSKQFYQLECSAREGNLRRAEGELEAIEGIFGQTRHDLDKWRQAAFDR